MVGVYEALTLPVAVLSDHQLPAHHHRRRQRRDAHRADGSRGHAAGSSEAVRTVPGLEDVRSVTSRGSAEINLFFNWTRRHARRRCSSSTPRSRARRARCPPATQIRTHRLDFSSFPIIGYSLTSDTVPQKDLWELATYEIKPRLNGLCPASASVIVQGGQRPEFHVVVDPARMLRAKTSIARHSSAPINRTNVVDSPGTPQPQPPALPRPRHRRRSTARKRSAHIVIKHVNNVPVHVQDVGNRRARQSNPIYTVGQRERQAGAARSASNRQPDSNTVQVADEVHQEMAAIRPTLPAGVEMRPFYDQSNIVQESIASVRDAIVIGLFLAGLIIWLFLRDWGTAVMTGLVVPVTMVVTFIAMKMLGQSFNLMTLGGLAAAVGLRDRRQDRRRREHRAAPRRRRGPARRRRPAR